MRRRIVRRTMGKDPIKKSATLIDNIGPSSTPLFSFLLIHVPIGRSNDGSTTVIRAGQNTDVTANVGDICKYVNIRIQAGARDSAAPEDDTSGWLEWGVVKSKEFLTPPPLTNLGTSTLGDVMTKMYRGDCLLTGAVPVGGDIPNSQDIIIKLPKIFCKMQQSSSLTLFCYYRSVNSASTATDLINLTASCQYKLYV